ncbi:MAG: flagellar hook protein FlgE [Gammaproteobacteria bacterium]|nr:flagellar hook protein FlgE [Gammaproteobacteria bacterium]
MGVSYDLNALSGINAASTGLGVISNNLANAQSVGFKGGRAEFADLFSGSQNSAGSGVRVSAVTQNFSQGTINGTARDLDMAIDGEGFFVLEDQTGKYDNVYTRNGSFKLDKDGYLTSQEGNRVQGYTLNEALSTEAIPVFETTLGAIDLDALNREPRATDEMKFDINLDGQEGNNTDPTDANGLTNSLGTTANLQALIDPKNAGPYNGFPDFSTNKVIHDSLGGEHRMTTNFYKRDVVNIASDIGQNPDGTYITDGSYVSGSGTDVKYTSWIAQVTMEDYDAETGVWITSGHQADPVTGAVLLSGGNPVAGAIYELRFDTQGNLIDVRSPDNSLAATGRDDDNNPLPEANWSTSGSSSNMSFIIDEPLTGASDPLGSSDGTSVSVQINFKEMSQFSGSYNLRGVSQNGFKIGDLVGLSTGLDGTIEARYSNGRSIPVARLGVANFADKNAMEKLGGQTYAESFASGTVQLGSPQSNGFGSVRAGSLEYSNVDVAGELVNMIQTQRTYQASAQVLSTSQTLTQTILNL